MSLKNYPPVKDEGCRFANGEYSIERSADFVGGFKLAVLEKIRGSRHPSDKYASKHPPFSYVWFRCLDDGDSPNYSLALRICNFCKKCHREWGQPYYANRCCK